MHTSKVFNLGLPLASKLPGASRNKDDLSSVPNILSELLKMCYF